MAGVAFAILWIGATAMMKSMKQRGTHGAAVMAEEAMKLDGGE